MWFHFDEMARQDQYRPFSSNVPDDRLHRCHPRRYCTHQEQQSGGAQPPGLQGRADGRCDHLQPRTFAQPFPLLELRFADLNGQLIASRRFKPSEYLSGELAGRGEMPSQTPIHIALDILDPGRRP
jgi:hypothetical protein